MCIVTTGLAPTGKFSGCSQKVVEKEQGCFVSGVAGGRGSVPVAYPRWVELTRIWLSSVNSQGYTVRGTELGRLQKLLGTKGSPTSAGLQETSHSGQAVWCKRSGLVWEKGSSSQMTRLGF